MDTPEDPSAEDRAAAAAADEGEPDIPAPAGAGQPLTDEDRVLLVFSYLGPLAVVAFLAARREYVRWHALQGIAFFIAAFAVILFVGMFADLAAAVHWTLGRVAGMFAAAINLGIFGLALLCILKSLKGERWRLPLLRDLADRL
jgi:uncharacterized membrane protein